MIRRTLHILLSILFCWQLSQAQVTSEKGNFQVDYVSGCVPLTVNVTDLSGSSATILYNYDYLNNDGANGFGFISATDTTYTTPGEYLLVQIIQVTTGPNTYDSLRITVRPADPPPFVVKPCVNHQATVEIDPLFYDSIGIYFTPFDNVKIGANQTPPIFSYSAGTRDISVRGFINNGANNCGESFQVFETIDALAPSQIQSVVVNNSDIQSGEIEINFSLSPNVLYELEMAENSDSNFNSLGYFQYPDDFLLIDTLNTTDNQYCFRFTAVNDCDPSLNLTGEFVCSPDIEVVVEPNQIAIEWDIISANVDYYLLLKDNLPLAVINDADQKYYIDSVVECNQNYCYQVEAVYTFGAVSQSDEICAVANAVTTPAAVENITASIASNGIEVNWNDPPEANDPDYQVYRSLNGGTLQLAGTIKETNFLDLVSIDTTKRYCYQINYLDACNNLSDSSVLACPVYVSTTIDEDGLLYLTWSNYSGWINGVQYYEVELLDENGQVVSVTDVGVNTKYQIITQAGDPQVKYFRIVGVSDFGGVTYSNILKVIDEAHVFFPTAFTPDGDGINDIFTAQGRYLEFYELRIFNRWGEMIFFSNRIDQGWNGTYNGIEAPQGNYTYSATVVDNLGNDLSTAGTVLLIRKNR
ncbi:MAG: gliding motility-associated C-terminal domain-containing protein [Cyclobacteriaceae bacterium]